MVSLAQEKHSIMKYSVPFLKVLTLYMLCKTQLLFEFYAVFCVYQILIK